MGLSQSTPATRIYPTITVVDEDEHVIVKLIYKDSYAFIQCPDSENHIRLHFSNISNVKTIMKEHARNYLSENKKIYMISNILPNRTAYTLDEKDLIAYDHNLESLLGLMVSVNIYTKIKSSSPGMTNSDICHQ